ncbi:hypothetical protein SNEBB_001339 [Seison nebaliae]|nr:hypothetical protein SNEBB_001339 [Seison nebaliae]
MSDTEMLLTEKTEHLETEKEDEPCCFLLFVEWTLIVMATILNCYALYNILKYYVSTDVHTASPPVVISHDNAFLPQILTELNSLHFVDINNNRNTDLIIRVDMNNHRIFPMMAGLHLVMITLIIQLCRSIYGKSSKEEPCVEK